MKVSESDIKVESTFDGEEVRLSIDENSLEHVMSLLSNLYENPISSILREYSTNSLDAHIAAGQKKPIEVTLPNAMNYELKIKDYGIGMSFEDIRNIYSKYGSSTKRGTNSQTGMLGLGCKSALTYTNQFNVVSVKDGMKANVLITRDESGTGTIVLIDHSSTEESNGTTVIIPTKPKDNFAEPARQFFKYWERGTVLVNGVEPTPIKETAKKVNDFYVVPNLYNRDEDVIVMGGVAYPVEESISLCNQYNAEKVVAFVDIGSLDFTPSREALHLTKKTKNLIAKLQNDFKISAREMIQSEINACSTHLEAIRVHEEYRCSRIFSDSVKSVTFNGLEFMNSLSPIDFVVEIWLSSSKAHPQGIIYSSEFEKIGAIFHGYEHEKVHGSHKAKVKKFFEDKGIESSRYLLVKEDITNPWLSAIPRFSWEEVRKTKLEKIATEGKSEEKYQFLQSNGYLGTCNSVDGKKIIYASQSEFNQDNKGIRISMAEDSNNLFLVVNKNKWKKLLTDYPQAQHWVDFLREKFKAYVNGQAKEDLKICQQNKEEIDFLRMLNSDNIQDEKLKIKIDEAKNIDMIDRRSSRKNYYWHYNLQSFLNVFGLVHPDREEYGDLMKDYSLINSLSKYSLGRLDVKHVELYINAVYNNSIKEKDGMK